MLVTDSKLLPPGSLQRSGLFLLSGFAGCFPLSNPFDRRGFADANTPANFERLGRLASLDQIVKQPAADAVSGAEIIDGLGMHAVVLSRIQKIPAGSIQRASRVSIIVAASREHYVNEQLRYPARYPA
jgi:hypothetical protein